MKKELSIKTLRMPDAPATIEKGASLGNLLGEQAVDCLAWNLSLAYPRFDKESFRAAALTGLEALGIMERGPHIAKALHRFLPNTFSKAIEVLLASLTAPLEHTEGNGLAVFFYHPHASYVAQFGLDPIHNGGKDPFVVAMKAQYELTKRFTAEYSIRPFLIQQADRTLAQLKKWTTDRSPHVRRLCSEGTRPRLPWAPRIPSFIADPAPVLPILEALKNDPSLYVRRSVANHLGDIAKDHADMAFSICERWLRNASDEVKWLLRHALRHPAKKGNQRALRLRAAAK